MDDTKETVSFRHKGQGSQHMNLQRLKVCSGPAQVQPQGIPHWERRMDPGLPL